MAIAAVWIVCAVVNAEPPSAVPLKAEAVRAQMGAAAHPHAMGAQASQAPAGAPSCPRRAPAAWTAIRTPRIRTRPAQNLSCVDCHGGNGTATTKEAAHVEADVPASSRRRRIPPNTYTMLNHENHDFIRFMNPSDLRTVPEVCGGCHAAIIRSVAKGPMVNSAQVYSTGLYNNSSIPWKDAKFVENYTPRGKPQIIRTIPAPTAEETRTKGILPVLFPLPRFENGQPGNILRIFERGGGPKSELGNPNTQDVPGQPDVFLSNRGFGTAGLGRSGRPRRPESPAERPGDVVPRHERLRG